MKRARLRVRTGCLTCKARRKKCDEQHDRCGPCRRLGLSCTWSNAFQDVFSSRPGEATRIKTGAESLSLVPAIRRDIGSSGYVSFSSQSQFDMVMQSPASLGLLISRSASAEFHDLSVLVGVAVQNDWARDTFAAFTALVKNADKLAGMEFYQSALSRSRKYIAVSSSDAHSIEMLTNITMLGVIESLGIGDARLAITHFDIASRLTQSLKLPPPSRTTDLALFRIAIECWLFNFATLAIYHPFPDTVINAIDWNLVDQVFGGPLSNWQLVLGSSPFIGGSHVIYKLILQVTLYARQNCDEQERQRFTQHVAQGLDVIADGLQSYYEVLPRDVAALYYWKYMLHILAVRIFLVKIADHDVSSGASDIRSIIEVACAILRRETTHESRNPAMAWPLVVFLLASHGSPARDFFSRTIVVIRDNFDLGHQRRLSAVLEALKEEDANQSGSSENPPHSYDTIDLLLSPQGILG